MESLKPGHKVMKKLNSGVQILHGLQNGGLMGDNQLTKHSTVEI